MTNQDNDPIVQPSDPPAEKAVKRQAGRGLVLFIIGVGVAAFVLYLTIILYAGITS